MAQATHCQHPDALALVYPEGGDREMVFTPAGAGAGSRRITKNRALAGPGEVTRHETGVLHGEVVLETDTEGGVVFCTLVRFNVSEVTEHLAALTNFIVGTQSH